MITGDSPLTTFHIAELAEFADRDALILDLKEKLNITDPSQSIDESLLAKYNIRMIRAAVKQFEGKPSWKALVQHNWVLCSQFLSAKGVHSHVPRVTGVHHAHTR